VVKKRPPAIWHYQELGSIGEFVIQFVPVLTQENTSPKIL